MSKRKLLLGLACLAVVFALVAVPTHAAESRQW